MLSFSRKLGVAVSRSSVDSIKKAYCKRIQEAGSDEVSTLPPRKRGRPCLLGDVENQFKLYLSKIRDQGGVITASVVVAAARGILMCFSKTKSTNFNTRFFS